MRLTLIALLAVTIVGISVPAFAELQNVEVGGSIRIRGNYYSEGVLSGFGLPGNLPGPSFNDSETTGTSSTGYVEQRTKINVSADFTDDVSAFIEIDAYNNWGGNQSNRGLLQAAGVEAPAGVDNNNQNSPVQFYQGYIEMREAWGYPLTFRVGRQEIQLGSEWLVGNNDTAGSFGGLSFDGALMTYGNDNFSLSTLWTRLVQNNGGGPIEDAGDADLMALYFSYTGLEDMVIDAYWIYANFAATAATNAAAAAAGGTPGIGGSAHIHTIGARFAGDAAGFDWEIEGAYQFGDSGADTGLIHGVAPPLAMDVEAFGVSGEAGYTFDVQTQPRLFIVGDYFSGIDDSDVGFNRLFSDHELSEFLGNTDLSNLWRIGGGVSIQATEEIDLTFIAAYMAPDEDATAGVGVPASPLDADALGTEVGIYMTYNYSEDLYFEMGYAHFFTDGDLALGTARVAANGLFPIGGGGAGADEDLDYIYFETGISF